MKKTYIAPSTNTVQLLSTNTIMAGSGQTTTSLYISTNGEGAGPMR